MIVFSHNTNQSAWYCGYDRLLKVDLQCRVIFYMPTRVGKTEAVYGRSRVNLNVKRGSTFYVYERPCIQIAAILFTRVKVLCAYAHKIYLTAEIHPKGGCTWRLNLLSGVLF